MKKLLTPTASSLALAATLLVSGQAQAAVQTWQWSFTDNACGSTNNSICNGDSANNYGDTWTQDSTAGNGPDTTVRGWSSTGDVPNDDTLETARLQHYGSNGMGVVNREELLGDVPDHAFGDSSTPTGDTFDNMDAVVFSFTEEITLDYVRFGWWSGDYDFSLLAWTGAGAPGDLTGDTYAGLVNGGGWSLIGHYYDSESTSIGSDVQFDVNDGDVSSSYYMLSVLNPELNSGSCTSASRTCVPDGYGGNDFFKLHTIGGYTHDNPPPPPPGVPVPATALLFLAALPLLRMRRKQA
ncbi:exosortase-dependent surface protein XDP1 [Motiliproteus sp.]|uniref:exosortase-dependent surface protein XDP1 n=1 Tax=Motiliproteus sp. TaxID=1898955 RepID=UPI003BAA42CD